MKGLNSTQHGRSVHVTFNVSKDVANHIQQSVVGSWKRMQDLGVVSIQLDREQLMCDNSRLCTEMSTIQSTEIQHCSRLSYPFNGYSESQPVMVNSCCRRSRGGTKSRRSGSGVSRRKRNDPPASDELCGSAVLTPSLIQQGTIYKNSDNASQRLNQDKDVAVLTSSEHDLFSSIHNLSSSHLPNHMSSNVAVCGTSLNMDSGAVSTQNLFIANALYPTSHEVVGALSLNTIQPNNLPPPSTPFVPMRRKRRKPVDSSSETVSAKSPLYMAVNTADHTMLPPCANGNGEAASYCTIKRLQLNGHYPQQFDTAVSCQYKVSNTQIMPLSCAWSPGPVNLGNYAKFPTERQMVLDASLTVSTGTGCLQTTNVGLKDTGMVLVKRNVQAGSNHLSQPSLGLNMSYPSRDQCGQLHQPAFSQACSPKLLNHFSQGALELMHRNQEIYGACAVTSADTKLVNCTERFCRSANSQLLSVSSPSSTERHYCSEINMASSTLRIKPTKTRSSLSLEASNIDSLTVGVKPLETETSSSVGVIENIHCLSTAASVTTPASVSSSSKSANFVVQSDMVDFNLPVSSSAVVKKHKPDVLNGYHSVSDCSPAEAWHTSHTLVPPAVSRIVNKSNFCLSAGSSDNVDNNCDFQTTADRSSVIEPALNKEAWQVAHTLPSVNMHSPHERDLCDSSIENNLTISGRYIFFQFQQLCVIYI